jgi:hypothetical protein
MIVSFWGYAGKAVFNGSIETPNIRGPSKGSLRLVY